MSLSPSLVGLGASGDSVTIVQSNFETSGIFSGPSYSGVKFDSDGNMYMRQAAGGWSSIGGWLLKGTNSNYYLQRVVNTGTLTSDAGDGVQLNADRIYDIQEAAPFTTKTATVTFEISTDAPGTTVVAVATALVFTTSWETGA